ncbi:MAG: ZIP family metal transporter, partial [Flavobacteriales bacterium]|nr:ZIP family metal transporter [Flavobacteriales bacterium]
PFGADTGHQHSLLAGIVLHKVPVAIVLASMCLGAGFTKMKSILILLLFAAMSPLGAMSYVVIEQTNLFAPEVIAPAVNALLVGILLHVSTTILFESSDSHRFNAAKFITIVIGLALAYIT